MKSRQFRRWGVTLTSVVIGSIPIADAASQRTLLSRLLVIETGLSSATSATAAPFDLRSELDAVIASLHSPGSTPTGAARVAALNDLIFDRLGIRATQELDEPAYLLPSHVLRRKQGYCVGIAALFLVAAERMNLPIFAVSTPDHLFLRYDDGATRINIETLERGANIPDEQYIREQKIPEASVRTGVFLRNLTPDEFLARLHNNLGVLRSAKGDYQAAATEYRTALDLDPRLSAAWYNQGNDLSRQGQVRQATRLFSKSLRLYPTDVWALNNRGLAYMKMGKPDVARQDFEAALAIDPEFDPARRNLKSLPSEPGSP